MYDLWFIVNVGFFEIMRGGYLMIGICRMGCLGYSSGRRVLLLWFVMGFNVSLVVVLSLICC